MRTFGILPIKFWEDNELQSLPVPTRLIAAYLRSGSHTNAIGCFRLPLSYVSEDLNLQMRFVKKAIKELTGISFLRFDEASKYFAITNFITARQKKWLANPNNYIAATKALEEIPDSVPFKKEIRLQLIEIKEKSSNNDSDDVLTPSEQRTNYKKEKEEGEEKGYEYKNKKGKGESQSAPASPPSSIYSDLSDSLPRSFSFPLKNGGCLEIDQEEITDWQPQFPSIVVQQRLQKHLKWFQDNSTKRMNADNTKKKIYEMLRQDNNERL